jgi:hypothetical protein
MRYRSLILIILVFALVLPNAPIQAQDGEDECVDLIRQAISDLGTNCANMDDNTACYGFDATTASFLETVPADFFTTPGERAELTNLVDLTTSDMNVDESEWGIGVVRAQTNIHRSLDEQTVFITIGDVEIENAVNPDDPTTLMPIVDPIDVTTTAEVNLYKMPNTDSEVLGTADSGATLPVDGVSPDGLWLRTVYNDHDRYYLAWVSLENLDSSVDVSGLPEISEDTQTPMQTIFLRNSLVRPECPKAMPPMLLIQGPNNTEIDITVDGTDIRVGSTIILQITGPNTMRLITVFGMATLNPDSASELLVPPGFSTVICLTDPADYGGLDDVDNDQIPSCEWSGRRAITRGDLDDFGWLAELPDNILNYPIEIPTPISPSGVGGAIQGFFFNNPEALELAREACDEGLLPEEICRYLIF